MLCAILKWSARRFCPWRLRSLGLAREKYPPLRATRSICTERVPSKPCWQFLDLVAGKAVGDPNVMGRLQVQPELRARSEPVAEPKRRIARDRSFPLHDLRDPIGRHRQLPRQFGWGNVELLKLIGKDFTGMDGRVMRLLICDSPRSRRCLARARPLSTRNKPATAR